MRTSTTKPLRVWPGVVIAILQLLVIFALPLVSPEAVVYGALGGVVAGLLVVVWWLLFSRARWFERLGAIVLMAVALFATYRVTDKSIATGAQGMLLPLLAIPGLSLAFVAWAVVTRHFSDGLRRVTMVATILLACGFWALVRTGGLMTNFTNDLHWRWTKTPEEQLMAKSGDEPGALPLDREATKIPEKPLATRPGSETAAPPAVQPADKAAEKRPVAEAGSGKTSLPLAPAVVKREADWPGFRGLHRDGVVHGARIKTDWAAAPPVELWRRPIGPGWSSFAVGGGLLYTQEQRGPDEVVTCYRLTTGQPVWAHRDAARFWESNAGAGPRATPTLSNGRVYTFGATGILNVLNSDSGDVVWSRNAASDTGTKVPGWGFSSSPLVVDDVVIVAASGRLAAYDLATGNPHWLGEDGGSSYSSPHLMNIDGVAQVLLLTDAGVTSVAPADGRVLWKYSWPGAAILQPALTEDGGILIATGGESGGIGTRRLAVTHGLDRWSAGEVWTSIGLKPYFNDLVVHNGHAFGFDGRILACIDLKDGKRNWKGGRYGNGQLVLLPDQDLLLVQSEEGELALVRATPDQFTELARVPAIEGKTWNHPALAGGILVVRNGQEMAAFRLPLAGS